VSVPVFSPSSYPAKPLMGPSLAEPVPTDVSQSASTGMGRDMVQGLALVMMAAVLAVLVLLTDRLLLDRTGVGHVLGGLVLWSVLLAALLMLSRVSVFASHAVLTWLDRAAFERARSRSRTRQGTPTP